MDDAMEVDTGHHHSNNLHHQQQQQQQAHHQPNNVTVVIDAPNVCWGYVTSILPDYKVNGRVLPPVTGLELCLNYFLQHGFSNVVAICPKWWQENSAYLIRQQASEPFAHLLRDDAERLNHLTQNQLLFLAPSSDHDDVYMIDYAMKANGFIVSNDLYRDHLQERNLPPEFVNQRRISYMFIKAEFLPNADCIAALHYFKSSVAPTSLYVPPSNFIANNSSIPSPSVVKREELRIVVPTDAIAYIIGRGGASINNIKEISGAKSIEFLRSTSNAATNQTQCLLFGTPEQNQKAVELINEKIYTVQLKNIEKKEIKYAKPDPL